MCEYVEHCIKDGFIDRILLRLGMDPGTRIRIINSCLRLRDYYEVIVNYSLTVDETIKQRHYRAVYPAPYSFDNPIVCTLPLGRFIRTVGNQYHQYDLDLEIKRISNPNLRSQVEKSPPVKQFAKIAMETLQVRDFTDLHRAISKCQLKVDRHVILPKPVDALMPRVLVWLPKHGRLIESFKNKVVLG